MTEKDKLLRRHLKRIQEHGYYHHIDVALVEWFISNASVKEICERYDVSSDALYTQRSRLARQEES